MILRLFFRGLFLPTTGKMPDCANWHVQCLGGVSYPIGVLKKEFHVNEKECIFGNYLITIGNFDNESIK